MTPTPEAPVPPSPWHEWGPTPFATARVEGRPVLVAFAASADAPLPTLNDEESARVVRVRVDADEAPEVADFATLAATVLAQATERPTALLLAADATPLAVGFGEDLSAVRDAIAQAAAGAVRPAESAVLQAIRRAQASTAGPGPAAREAAVRHAERLAGTASPVASPGALFLLAEAHERMRSAAAGRAAEKMLDRLAAARPTRDRLEDAAWRIYFHARLASGPVGPDADAARDGIAWAETVLLDGSGLFRQSPQDVRIFTAANGVMIRALALSGQRLERPADVARASRAAEILLERVGPSSALRRGFAGERLFGPARLDDYAALGLGLLQLHEATSDRRWLVAAEAVADAGVAALWDTRDGGFFLHPLPIEPLPVRIKSGYDGVWPSANAQMALLLHGLAERTGRTQHRELARRCVEAFAGDIQRAPSGLDGLLAAALHVWPAPAATPAPVASAPLPARIARGGVTLEARLEPPVLQRGARGRLIVDLAFAPGWSVTPNRPLERGGVGLTVTLLEPDLGAGAASYPTVSPSGMQAAVPLRVANDAAPGRRGVRVAVRLEACREGGRCEAPERVVLEAPLDVRP